jgi:flagellar basal-body rod protein FlgB
MPFGLDAELGLSAQSMQLHPRRLQLLAANIANTDTPNYKSQDIDFRAVLNRAAESGTSLKLAQTHQHHLGEPDLGVEP